jgi:hypothetical protein
LPPSIRGRPFRFLFFRVFTSHQQVFHTGKVLATEDIDAFMAGSVSLHERLCRLRDEPDGGGPYLEKDLLKAVDATSLVGAGGPGSSTERYVNAAGELANVAAYRSADRVFVSANGDRAGRVPVVDEHGAVQGVYALLQLMVDAGATIVADTVEYRDDVYNIGECELAGWLQQCAYHEERAGSGVWTPAPRD